MKLSSYHGSSPEIIKTISTKNISVNKGGGELGQGFYSGEHLHEAKAWAYQRFNKRKKNVLELEVDDNDFFSLEIKELNINQANLKRSFIKKINQTRTFHFNVDLVWSPIVGTSRVSGEQYKWESIDASNLLNSVKTIKTII